MKKVTEKKKIIKPANVSNTKQGLEHSLKTVNKAVKIAEKIFGEFTPSSATNILNDVCKQLKEHSLNSKQEITVIAEQLGVLSYYWELKRLQDVINSLTELLVFEEDIIYKDGKFIVDDSFNEHCSTIHDIVLRNSKIIHQYEQCELWIDRLDGLFELMEVNSIVWKKHRLNDIFSFLAIENDNLIPNVSFFLNLENNAGNL